MGKPITSLNKIESIQKLRRQGLSIKEIAKNTKSGVATVSKYTKEVKITKDGQARLLKRKYQSKTKSEETWSETLIVANKLIGNINDRDSR